MPVVELHRKSDDATWYLQVGDEHADAPNDITQLGVEDKALLVANGNGQEVQPGNGEPGWEVKTVHPDDKFHELYGVGEVT